MRPLLFFSRMNVKRLAFPAMVFALIALPILAQEAVPGGKSTDEPSYLWESLNFIILFAGIWWLAAKFGGPALRNRSKEIREGLAAGERARADAEARARDVQAKLATLDSEVALIRTRVREESERESERIRRESRGEMDRIRAQAQQEIASAGKLARLEVQRFAATLAIQLAEQKIRARMSPDAQTALVRTFLADLPAKAASNGNPHAG